MFRFHASHTATSALGRMSRLRWVMARPARLVATALISALALGLLAGFQSQPASEQVRWSPAPVVYASECQTQCCLPALATIHTNAYKGKWGGPRLQWRSHDPANPFVPVQFKLHYRSCSGGNKQVEFPGTLTADGQMQFTLLPDFSVHNWCPTNPDSQNDPIVLVNVHNEGTSDESCGNQLSSDGQCFTDTDWDLSIAQRVYGPTGNSGFSFFDFIGVTAELDPQAADPALFTRSLMGQCGTTDVAPTMTNSGSNGAYGLNCFSNDVCIKALFN